MSATNAELAALAPSRLRAGVVNVNRRATPSTWNRRSAG